MQKWLILLFSLVNLLILIPTQACTDFRITAIDRSVLITRSMEFNLDLHSNIRTAKRGRQFSSPPINNTAGKTWQGKYGYVYLDALNQDIVVDGMNEVGLSFEALYFPLETEYQTIPAGNENLTLPYFLFGDWVLSNFKTIEEVRAALPNVYVYAQTLPGLGNMIFPLHFSVYDASGHGLVIEFINGTMNVSMNVIGLLTNAPRYDWQINNMRNYLNLTPYTPIPVSDNGMTFSATGQGSGSIGLPGDVSPPSRFVKIAFLMRSVYPPTNAADALNVAEHIINNVDIPAGFARSMVNNKESADTTQWVVFKDLTHRIFYYRTYHDMSLRAISLDKINFSKEELKMPLENEPYIKDVTKLLMAEKRLSLVSILRNRSSRL